MPESDDNSQTAAYLSKFINTQTGEAKVFLGIWDTPGHRLAPPIECPAELASDPGLVRGWASEELATFGLKVDTWNTRPGFRQWDEGEYDYRAVGLEALPHPHEDWSNRWDGPRGLGEFHQSPPVPPLTGPIHTR